MCACACGMREPLTTAFSVLRPVRYSLWPLRKLCTYKDLQRVPVVPALRVRPRKHAIGLERLRCRVGLIEIARVRLRSRAAIVRRVAARLTPTIGTSPAGWSQTSVGRRRMHARRIVLREISIQPPPRERVVTKQVVLAVDVHCAGLGRRAEAEPLRILSEELRHELADGLARVARAPLCALPLALPV